MSAIATEMGAVARRAGGEEGLLCDDPGQPDREFWKHLGVSVQTSDLKHSGAHHGGKGNRLVFVRASEHRLRQRFTAAHEIGHFLLEDLRAVGADWVDAAAEERLCDDFASELLIPRAALYDALASDRRLSSRLLTSLCRRFRVNLQPMLIALCQTGLFAGYTVLLAGRRGHPSRPQEIDYRVEAQPFRGSIFLPRNQRLRSLGLGDVVDWAAPLDAGQHCEGSAGALRLPLWERGRGSGIATGRASWEAQTLAGNGLLVLIELGELQYQWKHPQKMRPSVTSSAASTDTTKETAISSSARLDTPKPTS